jgi:hypothetical protein
MIAASALVLSLLCFHGCTHRGMPESGQNVPDSAEAKARQIAIQKFDEESKLEPDMRKEYEITSVREEPDEWVIFFERKVQVLGGKVGVPGNHAHVTVNKTTSETKYFQGQ